METSTNENTNSAVIMEAVISFIAIFMPINIVKQVLRLVLIAAGIDNKNINRLIGYGESTIRKLNSDMSKKKMTQIHTIIRKGRNAEVFDGDKKS